ncbi:hypothetical protein SE17_42655, partial [Kouleothrix aurantiaca]
MLSAALLNPAGRVPAKWVWRLAPAPPIARSATKFFVKPMPHTFRHLFEHICEFEPLLAAYRRARRG